MGGSKYSTVNHGMGVRELGLNGTKELKHARVGGDVKHEVQDLAYLLLRLLQDDLLR